MNRTIAVLVCALLGGCGKPMSALDACKKLETAGVGAGCREDKPGGLGAAAVEKAVFDLPSVPGKTGQVLRFEKKEYFDQAVDSFAKTALLAGPHRYGSDKKLIFVQMNEGASLETGKTAKAVVEGL